MFDPQDIPPRSQEPATLAQVANRAAPIVGAIILSFGALESIMRTMIIGVRMSKASKAGIWPPDLKVSHKGRDRTNEWVREVLPSSGRQAEGDVFRERFTNVKHVRDNLARNIEAMWIDTGGGLRIVTLYENKSFDRDSKKWLDELTAGQRLKRSAPLPIRHTAYSDDDLASHYDEIRSLLLFVNEARKAEGLPIPLAQQSAEQGRDRRTPSDPQAKPK